MTHLVRRLTPWLLLAALTTPVSGLAAPRVFANPSTTVFINEIHYDNASTDTGEAIEVAGPAGTDLTGWSLVRYNGANGTVYTTPAADPSGSDILSGTIPDLGGGFGVVVVSYPSNGLQNGAPDGIALVDSSNAVIQFLSYEGAFSALDGPANGTLSTDIGVSEAGADPIGGSLQLSGTGTTYGEFTWAAPSAHTFGAPNTGQTFAVVVNAPVVAVCGGPLNAVEGFAASQAVSASDADGTVVDISITGVSPSPSAGSISLSGLAPAGGAGGMATASVDVDALVPPGSYTVQITAANDDGTPQTGTCNLTVSVLEVLPIGAVQGSVADSAVGTSHRSPYAPPTGNSAGTTVVTVQAVIYQKTLARTASGGSQNGILIQNTTATADGDPNSSDGIFVFMGGFTTLLRAGGGTYAPQVGDEIILSGRVSEFFNLSQLSAGLSVVRVVRSGVDLDAEVAAFDVNPPDNLDDANLYWERHEGMRARIPAGSLVVDSRDVFASTADGEVWVIRGDHPVAGRTNPYEARVFRDPHPLDNDPGHLFDDGNGYRIILGSLGVKAAAADNTELLAPARTFDTVNNALTGGVYFSFSKYQIMVGQQLDLTPGVDPSLNAPPQPFNRTQGYSLAPYNVENLYDRRDDPFDGCDFTGNLGCLGVRPPFDYVPASQAIYEAHLNDIAQQIIDDLHGPDIIFVQEAEDQDICNRGGGVLVCGFTDNADGKPDTLQELATVIASLGGPAYDAAYDRNGADDRGIVSAFLYRTDRVELLPASATDPVLGGAPSVSYRGTALAYNTEVQNPKALNADLPDDVDLTTGVDGTNVFTRPPQVGLFRIWRDGIGTSVFIDIYGMSNHFSSTPNARVGQRTEQALYDAAIVAALQAADPDVSIAVGGDFNVYPRPDDPFSPGQPRYPSDQLAALYDQGLTNLWDVLVAEVPAGAYSYIFQGQTQTLDQIFVTPSLLDEMVQVRAAHVNSDWPADFDGDGARGASDHDPQVAQLSLLPTLDRMKELVRYLVETGLITGNNTAENLIGHLDRAQRALDRGNTMEYRAHLQAFINQVLDFTPQFVSETASDALVTEAELLRSLGG